MASTNFIPFDEGLLNAESDSTYLVDPLRTGGAQSGDILPSPLFNKAMAQPSIFVSAFCEALVNKGYSPMDTPYATLVALLSVVRTSADFAASMIQVAYATSVTFNSSVSSGFDLTITGNVSASTLTTPSAGQQFTFVISQDATGSRTFVWPSQLTSVAGPICPFANSTSVQIFQVRYGGALVPIGPMMWLTANGVIIQPTPKVVQINTSGTVALGYNRIVEIVNCSGGNVTRNLFTAAGTGGMVYTCKRAPGDTSTNALIVQPGVGGQTIDGFPNFGPINPYNSFDFLSDNVSNFILV
jgi:hypothetical protein